MYLTPKPVFISMTVSELDFIKAKIRLESDYVKRQLLNQMYKQFEEIATVILDNAEIRNTEQIGTGKINLSLCLYIVDHNEVQKQIPRYEEVSPRYVNERSNKTRGFRSW